MPNHAPVTKRDVLRGRFGDAASQGRCPGTSRRLQRLPARVEDGLLRLPGIRARLASFKVPKANYRIDELPRNAMGKIDKPQLRARLGS